MEKSICIVQTNRGACDTFANLAEEVLPEVKTFQVIDDSLLGDINAAGGITPATARRLYTCCQMAQDRGADAILYTCVAAADAVELIAPFLDIPIVRIDEAVARQAANEGQSIAVLATAPTALEASAALVERIGAEAGKELNIQRVHLADAVAASNRGDAVAYRRLAQEAIVDAAKRNDVVVLAQPSMAALLPLDGDVATPVLAPGRNGFEFLREHIGL